MTSYHERNIIYKLYNAKGEVISEKRIFYRSMQWTSD